MLKYLETKARRIFRKNVEILFLLLLISGCSVTIGTTPRTAQRADASTHHSVRSGENLFRISEYYYSAERVRDINAGIERIKRANNLQTEQLRVGQRLLIPGTNRKQPSYALLPPDSISPGRRIPPSDQPSAEEFRPIIKDQAFIWPIEGQIICRFGELDNQGIDILVNPEESVRASSEGTVIFAGITPKYQETIIIKHPDDIYTVYAHDLEITVEQGDTVKQGDIIGKIKSGSQRTRYLHFEIRINNIPVNPAIYLPAQSR